MAADQGKFSMELALALDKLTITLPPLRERRESIPSLATHFATAMAEHLGKPAFEVSPEALSAMQSHNWPGNVRELEQRIQRAVASCDGPVIRAEDLQLL